MSDVVRMMHQALNTGGITEEMPKFSYIAFR